LLAEAVGADAVAGPAEQGCRDALVPATDLIYVQPLDLLSDLQPSAPGASTEADLAMASRAHPRRQITQSLCRPHGFLCAGFRRRHLSRKFLL
jgi:hypothetical protein